MCKIVDKNKYQLRIDKQLKLLEKDDMADKRKLEVYEVLVWLYQEHTETLESSLNDYKTYHTSKNIKNKIISDVKKDINKILDNY